jgi:hypothetical protein
MLLLLLLVLVAAACSHGWWRCRSQALTTAVQWFGNALHSIAIIFAASSLGDSATAIGSLFLAALPSPTPQISIDCIVCESMGVSLYQMVVL